MKKVLSIVFAGLILITGMHLSIAAHFCGGELASVKLSFKGQEATCGMEVVSTCPVHKELAASSCCKNRISYYTVDNNYSPSSFQTNEVIKKSVHFVASTFVNPRHSISLISHTSTNISPPELAISNAVKLPDICVFRI
ncbi:MAG TPA: hypothetical protein VHO72_03755 [Bacteroidales bacterium]|nr:hypothetical protein [Bacteroidales bacterium]